MWDDRINQSVYTVHQKMLAFKLHKNRAFVNYVQVHLSFNAVALVQQRQDVTTRQTMVKLGIGDTVRKYSLSPTLSPNDSLRGLLSLHCNVSPFLLILPLPCFHWWSPVPLIRSFHSLTSSRKSEKRNLIACFRAFPQSDGIPNSLHIRALCE